VDPAKLAHHKYLIENFRVQVSIAQLKDHVECNDTRKKDLNEDSDGQPIKPGCKHPSLKVHVTVGGTDAKSESADSVDSTALKFSLY